VVQTSAAGGSGSNGGRGRGILHGPSPFFSLFFTYCFSNMYIHSIMYLEYLNEKNLRVSFDITLIMGQYRCIPSTGTVSVGSGTVQENLTLSIPVVNLM